MSHFLTIDTGTMSIRAITYTATGDIVHEADYEYHSTARQGGLVEQDPLDFQQGLMSILIAASAFAHENDIRYESIAVTSQRASVFPVDANGRVLHPAVTWQDKRSADYAQRLIDELTLEHIYRRTGLRANPYFSLPKMMWFANEQPELYAAAHKLIGIQDYVIYLLTGRFVTDATQAARTMLLDIHTFTWDDEMFAASGIDRSKLSDLVPPGAIGGTLTPELAQVTGLPSGLPVILAGGDQQCAALALNVISEGKAEANTGTGSFALAHSESPVLHPECRVLCSASAMPGKWITEAGIFNSGAIYRWFRDELSGGDRSSYPVMNADAESSPTGANGVVLLPHFEGSAAPNWNNLAKGVFFNLSIGSSRGDLCRAILEGIALEITENLCLMEGLIGRLGSLSVSGGMSRSDLFNQIQADSFGRPVVRYDNPEASSLGALMSTMVTLGVADGYADAFTRVCPDEPTTYLPDDAAHHTYLEVAERRRVLYQALSRGGVYERFAEAI